MTEEKSNIGRVVEAVGGLVTSRPFVTGVVASLAYNALTRKSDSRVLPYIPDPPIEPVNYDSYQDQMQQIIPQPTPRIPTRPLGTLDEIITKNGRIIGVCLDATITFHLLSHQKVRIPINQIVEIRSDGYRAHVRLIDGTTHPISENVYIAFITFTGQRILVKCDKYESTSILAVTRQQASSLLKTVPLLLENLSDIYKRIPLLAFARLYGRKHLPAPIRQAYQHHPSYRDAISAIRQQREQTRINHQRAHFERKAAIKKQKFETFVDTHRQEHNDKKVTEGIHFFKAIMVNVFMICAMTWIILSVLRIHTTNFFYLLAIISPPGELCFLILHSFDKRKQKNIEEDWKRRDEIIQHEKQSLDLELKNLLRFR